VPWCRRRCHRGRIALVVSVSCSCDTDTDTSSCQPRTTTGPSAMQRDHYDQAAASAPTPHPPSTEIPTATRPKQYVTPTLHPAARPPAPTVAHRRDHHVGGGPATPTSPAVPARSPIR